MDAKKIAQVCHEANRALQTVQPNLGISVSPPWDLLDGETRESAVQGVQAILDNPEMTSEQSHQQWVAFKESKGWVYGTSKDEQKKTHPSLVEYSDLPEKERTKDALFGAVVRALA